MQSTIKKLCVVQLKIKTKTPLNEWGFCYTEFMPSMRERILAITGFDIDTVNTQEKTRTQQDSNIEIVTQFQEPKVQILSDNQAEISITFPFPNVHIHDLPHLKITNIYTHNGINSLDDRFATLIGSGVLNLVIRKILDGKSGKETLETTTMSRRQFIKLASIVSLVGSAAIVFGSKFNILGILANTGARTAKYDDIKSLLASYDPLRAFIGEMLQSKKRQETSTYSEHSININFSQQKNIHTEPCYTLSSIPVSWIETNKENAFDELLIYEPTDSDFKLELNSALAYPQDGKDVIGYQVGVFLRKLIERKGKKASYHSHNRYNEPVLGFPSPPSDSVMTDPHGIPSPVNYMHTGPLFLSFHDRKRGDPLFTTVPSWTAIPSMGWGGSVVAEKTMSLIEFICFANSYACWSVDMLPKYQKLSSQEKDYFFKLFVSKLKDQWGGIPIENYNYPAYHTIVTFDTQGNIQIMSDTQLISILTEKYTNNQLEEYLSCQNILRPVSLININTFDDIPTRENSVHNIAINFAVIKDNKCIGFITANQNRRVTMNQLRKIAQLWLDEKNIDYTNAYLVGMDEHGGGEVVNATEIE